jgi:type IV pilus assembly protein PilC|tara:strand:+ start:721 stop:1941 length:1221 start_codon:yes stop_codon:yes gene_type:complete
MEASDNRKVFIYSGQDRSGKQVNGQITAENKLLAEEMVRKIGVAADKIAPKPKFTLESLNRRTINSDEIVSFTRQLATMLKAGLPLIQSLDVAAESSDKAHIKAFIMSLRNEVAAGHTFSDSLRNYPNIFDNLYCNLVSAGEISGTLDIMLDRVATFREKDQRLKANIKKALTYPIAVLVIAGVVTAILLINVVPAFEQTFASFGSELPAFTRLVVSLSETMQEYWGWTLGFLVLAIGLFKIALNKSKRFSYAIDKYLLKAPVLGKIMLLSSIARFSRTLATTFSAGIPMLDALDSSAGAAGNQHIANAAIEVRDTVSQGSLLNVAMRSNSVFPPLLQQLTKVGEEAGALETMLNKAADSYEDSVNDAVDTTTALLEPAIMSFLAVVIGGLMIAMYLPIFQLGNVF